MCLLCMRKGISARHVTRARGREEPAAHLEPCVYRDVLRARAVAGPDPMTRAEWLGALRYADYRSAWQAYSIPFWRRVELIFLKLVAITGYYRGKYVALRRLDEYLQGLPREAPAEVTPSSSTSDTELRSATSSSGNGKRAPLMAVVVPFLTRNPEQLAKLVALVWQLHNQSRQADLIILVDDGSPLALPTCLGNQQFQILRLRRNGGPAAARNAGLSRARAAGAEIVCFTDADCTPASDWLAAMESAQLAQPGIVCGSTLSAVSETAIGLFHDLYGTLNGRISASGAVLYGCTCNLSIATRAVPLAFDESFRSAAFEDVEFCVRAAKQGVSIRHVSAARVSHSYDAGVRGLYRQFERYGLAEPQMLARHPDYLTMLYNSKDIPALAPGSGSKP